MRSRAMKTMERTEAVPHEAQEKGMPWDWVTFPEFMDSLDRTPKGVNLQVLQALSPLMGYVMGTENAKNRPATKEEMETMKQLLRDAMEAGGAGFGAQILGSTSVQRDYDGTPMITDTMAKEDLYAFGSVLAEFGRGFIQVAGPSMKSCENLAKASGRPILYNAVAVATDQHGTPLEQHGILLEWLNRVNKQGLRIFGQGITQDADTTFSLDNFNLFDFNPNWREITLGTPEERAAKIRDPKIRQRLVDEYDQGKGPLASNATQNREDPQNNADKLFLHTAFTEKNQEFVGMELQEIATKKKKHIVDTMLDLSLEEV